MTPENSRSADEGAIRAVIDAITKAVRAKDGRRLTKRKNRMTRGGLEIV